MQHESQVASQHTVQFSARRPNQQLLFIRRHRNAHHAVVQLALMRQRPLSLGDVQFLDFTVSAANEDVIVHHGHAEDAVGGDGHVGTENAAVDAENADFTACCAEEERVTVDVT